MSIKSFSYFSKIAADFYTSQAHLTAFISEKAVGDLARLLTDMYLEGKSAGNVTKNMAEN